MKKTIIFFLLSSALLFLNSCKEEVKPLASTLSVDNAELQFDAEGSTASSVNITSDGDWIAVIPEWIKLSQNSGSGNTEISVSVTRNYDSDNVLAGTRRGKIMIYGNGVEAEIAVQQEGDPNKDLQRTYKKVTAVQSGKNYLIAYDNKVANPVPSGSGYGYLKCTDVEIVSDCITMPTPDNAFTFTAEGDGYKITQKDGRIMYQSGSYDSFNVSDAPTEGYVWTVEFQTDGTAKILNKSVNKFIQYDLQYGSYGSYSSEEGKLPMLYEEQL